MTVWERIFLCLGLAKSKFEYKPNVTCTIAVVVCVDGRDGRCWFVINSDGERVVLSGGRVHGWRVTGFVTQRDVCRGEGSFGFGGIGSHPLGLYRRPELRFDLKPAQGPSKILLTPHHSLYPPLHTIQCLTYTTVHAISTVLRFLLVL